MIVARKPNVSVSLRSDESIERALRRFKRMCERAGILKIVRSKRHYQKPSEARRHDARKQVRNRRRAERKAKERQDRKMRKAKSRQRSYVQKAFSVPVPPQPGAADGAAPAVAAAAEE
jgi:small subunit ribosomal protein S21